MAQGKRISVDIGGDALQAIKDMGAAAKLARTQAGEGQASAAAKLGVHVQTIARIEAGEPGVAIGHVIGLLALYGIATNLKVTGDSQHRTNQVADPVSAAANKGAGFRVERSLKKISDDANAELFSAETAHATFGKVRSAY